MEQIPGTKSKLTIEKKKAALLTCLLHHVLGGWDGWFSGGFEFQLRYHLQQGTGSVIGDKTKEVDLKSPGMVTWGQVRKCQRKAGYSGANAASCPWVRGWASRCVTCALPRAQGPRQLVPVNRALLSEGSEPLGAALCCLPSSTPPSCFGVADSGPPEVQRDEGQ